MKLRRNQSTAVILLGKDTKHKESLYGFVRISRFTIIFFALFVDRIDKIKKSSKISGNFLVDLLPILY